MLRRKILWLLVFFLLPFNCLYASGSFPAQTDSGAQEEKTDLYQWNFGKVKQGAVLKHDFVLKNETKSILGINNLHTSCGCAVSESTKKSLMPQESSTIKVTFDSSGYLGPVSQFVYVNTDNPDLEIIKFTIKAYVVKD